MRTYTSECKRTHILTQAYTQSHRKHVHPHTNRHTHRQAHIPKETLSFHACTSTHKQSSSRESVIQTLKTVLPHNLSPRLLSQLQHYVLSPIYLFFNLKKICFAITWLMRTDIDGHRKLKKKQFRKRFSL